jgi:methylaspartate ammonia-lyase
VPIDALGCNEAALESTPLRMRIQSEPMTIRITDVLSSIGLACDYYTDSAASDRGVSDGLFVAGDPVTPGFSSIHERARCLNLQLLLEDGSVGLGDCLSVIRSGAHDRAAPLSPEVQQDVVVNAVSPRLAGLEVDSFRSLASTLDGLQAGHSPPHPGLLYGLSQAMLDAVACAQRRTMAEVIADEYGLAPPTGAVPMFGCTDWRRSQGVDQLIAGRADAMPHGGFTTVDAIGTDGEKLVAFVEWMTQRIGRHSPADHRPTIHLDVYGTIGAICGGDTERTVAYLHCLHLAAAPYPLRIEDPVSAGAAGASRDAMRELVEAVDAEGLPVEIVADEYCNTVEDIGLWADERAAHMIHVKTPDLGSLTNTAEAIQRCRRAAVGVYVGGTMNDTEVSARAALHIALAFGADLVMAKPGAWPDVSLALTRNEMERTLRLCAARAVARR